jgi:hypothetical protein
MQALRLALLAGLVAGAAPAWSASYNFDVLYTGDGNAELVAGSDDPGTTTLMAGDSFSWTISALPGHGWTVLSGGTVDPLMAFEMWEAAVRTSNHTLTLSNNGAPMLSLVQSGEVQSQFHMGTNAVALSTGLVFDTLQLQYSLLSALTATGQATGSTPFGILPIFGMPDVAVDGNTSQTIYGPVPEPATWALWLLGLGAVGALARRRVGT